MRGHRARAAAGAGGVVVLTATWVSAGLRTDGFDPVRQSISQLQREGTPTGTALTAAFVAFAGGALLAAPVVGHRAGGAPRLAVVAVALATLGAAASPLGEVRGGAQDALHLAFGATGYLSLSVLPLLAARRLTGRARAASYALGGLASLCLLGTVPADAVSGALQRVGFLAGHLWLAGLCVAVLRDPAADRPPAGRGASCERLPTAPLRP